MTPREYFAMMNNNSGNNNKGIKVSNDGIQAITTDNTLQVQQYAFKVSLESDQKAVKPSITVYSNNLDVAIDTAVQGFLNTRKKLIDANIVTAPLGEVNKER